MKNKTALSNLQIPLETNIFLRTLINEIAGILEDVVGFNEASGFAGLVGQHMGEWLNDMYKKELGVSSLSREQVAAVLVDFKARIEGGFSITSQDDEKIVFENTTCPYKEQITDRPVMCMVTSSMFGFIAAQNLGYAKVAIEKSIVQKDDKCRLVVFLKPTHEAQEAKGQEYFKVI